MKRLWIQSWFPDVEAARRGPMQHRLSEVPAWPEGPKVELTDEEWSDYLETQKRVQYWRYRVAELRQEALRRGQHETVRSVP